MFKSQVVSLPGFEHFIFTLTGKFLREFPFLPLRNCQNWQRARVALQIASFSWSTLSSSVALNKRTSREQRETPSLAFGICEFHQSYFRCLKSVSWDVRIISAGCTWKCVSSTKAISVVNKRKGFIVKGNADWKIDSSISLDLADSRKRLSLSPNSDYL